MCSIPIFAFVFVTNLFVAQQSASSRGTRSGRAQAAEKQQLDGRGGSRQAPGACPQLSRTRTTTYWEGERFCAPQQAASGMLRMQTSQSISTGAVTSRLQHTIELVRVMTMLVLACSGWTAGCATTVDGWRSLTWSPSTPAPPQISAGACLQDTSVMNQECSKCCRPGVGIGSTVRPAATRADHQQLAWVQHQWVQGNTAVTILVSVGSALACVHRDATANISTCS